VYKNMRRIIISLYDKLLNAKWS